MFGAFRLCIVLISENRLPTFHTKYPSVALGENASCCLEAQGDKLLQRPCSGTHLRLQGGANGRTLPSLGMSEAEPNSGGGLQEPVSHYVCIASAKRGGWGLKEGIRAKKA